MIRRTFLKCGAALSAIAALPVSACTTGECMRLDANDFPTLKDAIAEAERVKTTTGSILTVSGGVHDISGVNWPVNTVVEGTGDLCELVGESQITSVKGTSFSGLNFASPVNLVNCRSVEFKNLIFQDVVRVSGASYYNLFSMCNWYKVNKMMVVTGECNFNKIRDCRVHHTGDALTFLPDVNGKLADGWRVNETAFEGWTASGTGTVGAAHVIRGKQHIFRDNWYEPGGNKDYLEYTIIFEKEANGCEIVRGTRPWKFRVRDRSGGNRW